jgi:hypothetical protein
VEEKLGVLFDIMDVDEDGKVTKKEMAQFLNNVYRAAGHPRTMRRVLQDVDAIFESKGVLRDPSAGLSWEDFKEASHSVRIVTGETLADLFDVVTERFTTALHDPDREDAGEEEPVHDSSIRRSVTSPPPSSLKK